MPEIEMVNENGYKALRNLAGRQPKLFTEPDVGRLRQEMEREAGTPDVWREPMRIAHPLDSLNQNKEKGPGTDARFSKIMRQALANISLIQAADELLWASINCFAIADYVAPRWATSNIRHSNPERFVDRHWLKGGPDARQDNAAARLWWLGEISDRVSRCTNKYTSDELLDAMAGNVRLYHQTLDRRYLLGNPRIVAAIYEVALDGNDHLFQTTPASNLFKSLNVRAGATALDFMEDAELRALVRECVPPKG